MTSNVGCWKRRLAVLAITTSLLSGCATVDSEPRIVTVCPPVVEYSAIDQTHAAAEIEALPENAVVVGMLSDYAVLRDQARACM